MKHIRLVGTGAIILMLALCLAASIGYTALHGNLERSSYAEPLPAAPQEDDPLAHIRDDFVVDRDFSSHLPIVILDTGGIDPPINTQIEGDRFVAIEGVDPYVKGTLTLLDDPSGENHLGDEPAVVSHMIIKRRGNSSMLYEKAQWLVKLQTESGQDNDVDLLGMGAEHEWVLNGSMADKSMLRNYLAYSAASELSLLTPDSQFCEVLIRNGNTYTYQGVYLLCESIKQGVDRVPIQEYESSRSVNSYLARRDRFEENVTMLDTYARNMGYSKEWIELLYPTRTKVSDEMIAYVENDLNQIEKVLYAEDEKTFSAYHQLIDVESFVDYFLFNEFFGSYDSGNYSTYFYKDLGGKLTMGPVWDYDGTMDNYIYEPLAAEDLAFQTKPWFEQLCQDKAFVNALQKRYTELRATVFSSQNINAKIDEIVAYLGGAQEREWARWGHWYTTQNRYSLEDYLTEDDTVLYRNATTYSEEISRIKSALYEHGNNIFTALQVLEQDCIWDTGMDSWRGLLLLFAAMLFLVPAYYVSYRK